MGANRGALRAGAPLLAVVFALPCCAPVVPPLADTGGDLAFKARIADRHPPGSRAQSLRDELFRQGFTITEAERPRTVAAVYRPENLPCYSVTRITWREDRRGRIVEIKAARQACS